MTNDKKPTPDLLGVGGCRGGWSGVKQDGRTGTIRTRMWPTFEELLAWAPAPAIVAVDMPIGLASTGKRGCDVAARALLKWPRSASVFQTPVRQTLGSTSHVDACDRHRAVTTQCISRQAFNILHKIAEVDELRRGPSPNATRVFEVHPELTFMQLRIDQGSPPGGVMEPKGKPGGQGARKALLATAFGPDLVAALAAHIAGKARLDDIVDAFASLWSARRIADGTACKVPDQDEIDVLGLPMAILRCRFGRPKARI
jgi:predicted RNase H-like nuclease